MTQAKHQSNGMHKVNMQSENESQYALEAL